MWLYYVSGILTIPTFFLLWLCFEYLKELFSTPSEIQYLKYRLDNMELVAHKLSVAQINKKRK